MPKNIYWRKHRVDGKVYNGLEAVSNKVDWRPVLVKVRDKSSPIPAIVMQLHDQLFRESGGQIPYDLIAFCPYCGDDFQITGDKRKITVDYYDKPREFEVPVWDEALGQMKQGSFKQTANVSVDGVLTCPGDAPNGKGLCAYCFKITDNVLTRA